MDELDLSGLGPISTRRVDPRTGQTIPGSYSTGNGPVADWMANIWQAGSGAIDGVVDWWTTPGQQQVGFDPRTGQPVYSGPVNAYPGRTEAVSPLTTLIQSILPSWAYPNNQTNLVSNRRQNSGALDQYLFGTVTVGQALMIGAVVVVGFVAVKKL